MSATALIFPIEGIHQIPDYGRWLQGESVETTASASVEDVSVSGRLGIGQDGGTRWTDLVFCAEQDGGSAAWRNRLPHL